MRLFLTTEFHAIFSHFVLSEKRCPLHFFIGEQFIKKKIYYGIYNGQFKNKMNSLKLCVGDEMIIMCIYEFMSYFSNFMS